MTYITNLNKNKKYTQPYSYLLVGLEAEPLFNRKLEKHSLFNQSTRNSKTNIEIIAP